ncbi:helix-turn-helix domain-containing protein [Marinicrinis sediminis]|uniref:Helix-turn-helix domain-containing protein n=1 Tax=Marinicrinis sediminis TaxID=1652465 RepID=A0ABW5RCP0_9BACL
MDFYQQLKGLRKRRGYTIREVSDRSGVSSAYISQLENGNRGIPSPEILMKLSEGLNISYGELMQIAGYLENQEHQEHGEITNPINLRRLIRENDLVFDGILLTEEDKEWIDRVLTALFWMRKKETQRDDVPMHRDPDSDRESDSEIDSQETGT